MKSLTRIRAVAVLSLLLRAAPSLGAQTDTLRSARALSDSSRFGDAIALLKPYMEAHPTNGDGARLLSALFYWVHDISGARAVADSSLALHPEDASLRLQYGSMLVDIGDGPKAKAVLAPLVDSPARGRALGILGTLAYWRGDLAVARTLYADALRAEPDQPEVRRALGSILEATAPWISTEVVARNDDQPMTSIGMKAAAGWFPTPLMQVAARLEPTIFAVSDSAAREMSSLEVSVSNYVPSAHLDLELAAGALHRSFGSSADWLGRAAISIRMPSHVTATVRGQRSPYTYTVASVSIPVMTTSAATLLRLDAPTGWLGEISVGTQRFRDDNRVNTAYAWALAPLVHRTGGDFRIGYGVDWKDALHSRFVLARPVQPVPIASAQFDFPGRYSPYYTPQDVKSHSVLASGSVHVSRGVALRGDASYGFHASEDATTFLAGTPPTNVVPLVAHRLFTPWNVGAGIDISNRSGLAVSSTLQGTHTAFYTALSTSVKLSYKFGADSRRELAGF